MQDVQRQAQDDQVNGIQDPQGCEVRERRQKRVVAGNSPKGRACKLVARRIPARSACGGTRARRALRGRPKHRRRHSTQGSRNVPKTAT
eukprot:6212877-Pleurochrysis_carterae.AAC.3